MGLVAGVLVWGYASAVRADRKGLVRWAFAAAVGCFLFGALLATLVGRSLAQEFLFRKSLLGLALFLLAGASAAGLLNLLVRWGDADNT